MLTEYNFSNSNHTFTCFFFFKSISVLLFTHFRESVLMSFATSFRFMHYMCLNLWIKLMHEMRIFMHLSSSYELMHIIVSLPYANTFVLKKKTFCVPLVIKSYGYFRIRTGYSYQRTQDDSMNLISNIALSPDLAFILMSSLSPATGINLTSLS